MPSDLQEDCSAKFAKEKNEKRKLFFKNSWSFGELCPNFLHLKAFELSLAFWVVVGPDPNKARPPPFPKKSQIFVLLGFTHFKISLKEILEWVNGRVMPNPKFPLLENLRFFWKRGGGWLIKFILYIKLP